MAKPKKVNRNVNLDEYEADLERHAGQVKPLCKQKKSSHVAKLEQAADNYVKKDKRINIRVY